MVPGVNWKVDLRPFEGVARAPHDTTTRQKMVNVTLLPICKGGHNIRGAMGPPCTVSSSIMHCVIRHVHENDVLQYLSE